MKSSKQTSLNPYLKLASQTFATDSLATFHSFLTGGGYMKDLAKQADVTVTYKKQLSRVGLNVRQVEELEKFLSNFMGIFSDRTSSRILNGYTPTPSLKIHAFGLTSAFGSVQSLELVSIFSGVLEQQDAMLDIFVVALKQNPDYTRPIILVSSPFNLPLASSKAESLINFIMLASERLSVILHDMKNDNFTLGHTIALGTIGGVLIENTKTILSSPEEQQFFLKTMLFIQSNIEAIFSEDVEVSFEDIIMSMNNLFGEERAKRVSSATSNFFSIYTSLSDGVSAGVDSEAKISPKDVNIRPSIPRELSCSIISGQKAQVLAFNKNKKEATNQKNETPNTQQKSKLAFKPGFFL